MCVVWNTDREEVARNVRMSYEACDGTAPDKRGVWRIAGATGSESHSLTNQRIAYCPKSRRNFSV